MSAIDPQYTNLEFLLAQKSWVFGVVGWVLSLIYDNNGDTRVDRYHLDAPIQILKQMGGSNWLFCGVIQNVEELNTLLWLKYPNITFTLYWHSNDNWMI